MLPDLGPQGPLYLAIAGVVLAIAIARRIPVLRAIVSIGGWLVLAGLLVAVLGQREMFDPYLGGIAAALKLDEQEVVGDEVRIRQSSDGHFWVRVDVGGVRQRMLVDSGATVTALSTRTAQQMGLEPSDGLVPVLLTTANGTIRAQTVTIPELHLSSIVARDLSAVVSPAFGDVNVVGMNFLSRLKSWRVEGRTLILVPHHPQRATT